MEGVTARGGGGLGVGHGAPPVPHLVRTTLFSVIDLSSGGGGIRSNVIILTIVISVVIVGCVRARMRVSWHKHTNDDKHMEDHGCASCAVRTCGAPHLLELAAALRAAREADRARPLRGGGTRVMKATTNVEQ